MAPSSFWSTNGFSFQGLGQAFEALKQLAIPAVEKIRAYYTPPTIVESERAFASAVEHRINQGGECTIVVKLGPAALDAISTPGKNQIRPLTQSSWTEEVVSATAAFRSGESIRFAWMLPNKAAGPGGGESVPCSAALSCMVAIEQQRRLQELFPEADITLCLSCVPKTPKGSNAVSSEERALLVIKQEAQKEGITGEVINAFFSTPLFLPNLADAFQDSL
jgi:hypothetical protein